MLMKPLASQLLVGCLVLPILLGCEPAKPITQPQDTQLGAVDAPGTSDTSTSNITDPEAEDFAQKWVQALDDSDIATIERLVNWKGIAERAIEPFGLDQKKKKSFVAGAMSGFTKSIMNSLAVVLQNGGSYRLVRVARRDGEPHVVLRLLDSEGSLNYHDFKLERVGGEVRASHLFVALTGEEMSDTIRKMLAPAIRQQSSLLANSTQLDQKVMDDTEKLFPMAHALQQGDKASVLRIYQTLPESLRKTKMAMLYRVMATDVNQTEAYLAAIEEYASLFSEDVSLGLLMMDAGILRNDVDLVRRSYKEINAWTGGDPYLDLAIGMILCTMDDVPGGVKLAASVDPAGVNLEDAHLFKLALAAYADDIPEAIRQLRILRDQYNGVSQAALSQAPIYQKLLASKEFQAFQQE